MLKTDNCLPITKKRVNQYVKERFVFLSPFSPLQIGEGAGGEAVEKHV